MSDGPRATEQERQEEALEIMPADDPQAYAPPVSADKHGWQLAARVRDLRRARLLAPNSRGSFDRVPPSRACYICIPYELYLGPEGGYIASEELWEWPYKGDDAWPVSHCRY